MKITIRKISCRKAANIILLLLALISLLSCELGGRVELSYYPTSLTLDSNDNLLTVGTNSSGQVVLKSYGDSTKAYRLDDIRTDVDYHRYSLLYPNQDFILYVASEWYKSSGFEDLEANIISVDVVSHAQTESRTLYYPIQSKDEYIYFSSSYDIFVLDKINNTINQVESFLDSKTRWLVQYDSMNDSLYYLNQVNPSYVDDRKKDLPNNIYVADENQGYSLSLINDEIRKQNRYPISFTIENGVSYVSMLDRNMKFSFLAYEIRTGVVKYDITSNISIPLLQPATFMTVDSDNLYLGFSDLLSTSNDIGLDLDYYAKEILKVDPDGNLEILSIGQTTDYQSILFPFFIDNKGNLCGRFIYSFDEIGFPNPPTLGRLSPDGSFISYDENAPISNPRPISDYFESLK